MLCESCGMRTANVALEQSINGKKSSIRLCSQCAAKAGVGSLLQNAGLKLSTSNLGNQLGSFFSNLNSTEKQENRCPVCNSTISTIASKGKIGCANCYAHFKTSLLPSIHRIHGNTNHVGKVPKSAGPRLRLRSELASLKKELEQAIEQQRFEEAANIRDKINEIKRGEDLE
ncbi:MAG: hypothetical protein GX988_00850 [Clostridiales bacterium]|nr:hypothetical protein [Clostridiales bacterium]